MKPDMERYLSREHVTLPFHEKRLLRDIWGDAPGVSDEFGKIRMVMMHRPGQEVLQLHEKGRDIKPRTIAAEQTHMKGTTPEAIKPPATPDLNVLLSQFDALQRVLKDEGITIIPLEGRSDFWPERLYCRDLGMAIPGGVILTRLALALRYGETPLAMQTISKHNVPIIGMIQGSGFAEGGNFMMLDPSTAIIGRTERTNTEGIEQVRHLLALRDIQLLVVDLPSSIIHLDEAFLMLDRKLALVHTALLPYWFLIELHLRGIELIHVDPRDPPLTINALTVAPGRVLMSSDGERTIKLLESQGVTAIPVEVNEIYKLGGGLHCLALPLIRD
ncbi:dimethylarginine dimethylaminohydrolase family protein [Paenibacillus soyae]|uniref:Arginine deiminase family protein n=1 Tax=Paenibacillus soyae TaxID=2969249 RepID=A0A9X2MWA1_9BACL|nr:arginine deiminase family protein [Paenibacillus soyae]MCR2807630.1 arginine deiminase family protein [Paenibacillus soyae]